MEIYKACIVSSKHAEKNKPCQDFCAIMPTYDGFIAGGLSDGAGSARFADFAAFTNVQAFFNYMRKYTEKYSLKELVTLDNKELGDDVVFYCKTAINTLINRMNLDQSELAEFSATFLGFVIIEDEIIFFHLGDGEIYGLTSDNKVECLSFADNVMGLSNQTHFTIDDDAIKHMRVFRTKKDYLKAFLLMSDGVMPISDSRDNHIAALTFSEWLNGHLTNDISLCRLIDNEQTKLHNDDHSMIFVSLG